MFRFRLSKVLDYRCLQEKQCQQEMLDTQHYLAQQEASLAAMLRERRTLEAELSTSQGSVLLGHQLQRWRDYHQHIARRVEAQQATVAEAKQALEVARQALMRTQKKKKIIEILREKALQQHLRERQTLEQRSIDEIGIMRSSHGIQIESQG